MYDKKILKDNLPKRMRYYQGMIDLNILEKGENYKNLKKSFVIFICTFDLFGLGRHVYTFENRCIEDLELPLGDDTTKIILNTKGTLDDVSPEMKRLLDYVDGKGVSDTFTRDLEEAVQSARQNEKWRLDYMTLQMNYQEKYEQGIEQGREQSNRQSALRMIKAGKLSNDEIALYSGLTTEQVEALEEMFQGNGDTF